MFWHRLYNLSLFSTCRAAQRLELKGVQAYSDIEKLQGLHTLPTAVVDYRGVRLSAQGLAPGLEGSDQDQDTNPASRWTHYSIIHCSRGFNFVKPTCLSNCFLLFRRGLLYGVNAGPQESPQRRKLLELLASAAKSLCLQRHVVVTPNSNQVPLFTSVDAQGLLGADGRYYILDVFRTFPADANFCPEAETESQTVTGEEESNTICENDEKKKDCVKEGWLENYKSETGLPKSFPHGLCRLRPELVQAFIQHKWVYYIKHIKTLFLKFLSQSWSFLFCFF